MCDNVRGAMKRETVVFSTVFMLLSLIALAPFALCSPLPLGDYVNHLARLHIITSLGESAALSQFYQIHWAPIPNLAADILVPPVAHLIGVEQASTTLTALSLLLIASGAVRISRALHGSISVLPLLVFFLLYSRTFLWGFTNYIFAVGIMLWTLASWIRVRDRLGPGTALVFCVPTTTLYFCHLHPVAIYAICVFSIQSVDCAYGTFGMRQCLRRLLLAAVQFVPAALLMLVGNPTTSRAGDVAFGSIASKIAGLIEGFNNYSLVLDICTAALFIGLIALGIMRRKLRVHALLRPALLILALCYLIMPNILFSSTGADRRLIVVLMILLVASLNWADTPRASVRTGLAVVALALFLARMAVVAVNWRAAQLVYARIESGVSLISYGSRVACLVAEPSKPSLRNPPLVNFCNIVVLRRDAFVNALFAEPGKQILQVPYNADTQFNRAESQIYRFEASVDGKPPVPDVLQSVPLDRFDWVLVIHEQFFAGSRAGLDLTWHDQTDDVSLYRTRLIAAN